MSTIREAAPRLDARLGKFSQVGTFVLTGLAFVLHLPAMVLITTVLLALSALVPVIGPYRFAQGVATVFLLVSTLVLFLSHATVLGWTLDLLVFVLSGINLFVGFCAGCFVYYHLGRLGITPPVRYEGRFHWRGV